jgi:NitT/TauT family transport system ATP-binding protein
VQVIATHLGKVFRSNGRETVAFQDISFQIHPGEFFCIVGPSGCGKTTLLRTLAGLETHSSGQLEIKPVNGADAPSVGMVFQEHGLFPWMSLRNNVRFLLEDNPRLAGQNVDVACDRYLAKVGLSAFAHYYPHQVSGGMRQRVSVARSFATEPDILLMDEPFVFLDYQARLALQQQLLLIWEETRKTVAFVTHDIEEAILLADRVLVLSEHPGRVQALLDIDLPRPRQFTALRKHPAYLDYVEQISSLLQRNRIDAPGSVAEGLLS